MNIFEVIFYQPIFNILVFFYNTIAQLDIGVAILLVTVLIKVILLPFSIKTLHAQKELQQLQPKLKEIQQKNKDNKEALARATMELYKKEKINPFSSCLPLLVQLPFLFAVFKVFRDGFKPETLNLVYSFINRPESINPISLGIINLAEASVLLALLAGIAQFIQTRMLTHVKQPKVEGSKDESFAVLMNKNMMYMMPIVTVFIGARLPGGLTLYWLIFTILTILQQRLIFKNKKSISGNT